MWVAYQDQLKKSFFCFVLFFFFFCLSSLVTFPRSLMTVAFISIPIKQKSSGHVQLSLLHSLIGRLNQIIPEQTFDVTSVTIHTFFHLQYSSFLINCLDTDEQSTIVKEESQNSHIWYICIFLNEKNMPIYGGYLKMQKPPLGMILSAFFYHRKNTLLLPPDFQCSLTLPLSFLFL